MGGRGRRLAALATFLPAVGTLSATVDADTRGVTIRRFGRTARYAWAEVVECRVSSSAGRACPTAPSTTGSCRAGRATSSPFPCLELADGRVRELPALAAAADAAVAHAHAMTLAQLRNRVTAAPNAAPVPLAT